MDKPYLLGIDIGTSACKVAVFDREGQVMALWKRRLPGLLSEGRLGGADPEEWWTAVCGAIQKTLHKGGISPEQIAGVGIDGQSWSAIAIDQEGKVLTNTPIWMDTRASPSATGLMRKSERDEIFKVSGNSLQPSYTTAKILWYKENSSGNLSENL